MPEYDNNNGIGIWELSSYNTIRDNIIENVEECRDKDNVIGKVGILVFGSFGRGKAKINKSDLDLIILTQGKWEGMVGVVLQNNTMGFDDCIESRTERDIKTNTNGKVDEVDVRLETIEAPGTFIPAALREKEPNKMYDLISEDFIGLQDIQNMPGPQTISEDELNKRKNPLGIELI